jgi:hypothetical protein
LLQEEPLSIPDKPSSNICNQFILMEMYKIKRGTF